MPVLLEHAHHKEGTRRKKFETIQLWYCKDCDVVFTPRPLKGKTYPVPVIVDGLGYYHMGYSLVDASALLKERYGVRVSPATLSRWLDDYKKLCTYSRLRNRGMALFPPRQIFQSTRLHHQQVYSTGQCPLDEINGMGSLPRAQWVHSLVFPQLFQCVRSRAGARFAGLKSSPVE